MLFFAALTAFTVITPALSSTVLHNGDDPNGSCSFYSVQEIDIPFMNSLSDQFPYTVPGLDIENRTVFVVEVAKWNFTKLAELDATNSCAVDMYLSTVFKIFNALGRENGNILIADFQGFDHLQLSDRSAIIFTFKLMNKMKEIEPHVAYGYFINVNFGARGFVDLARPSLGKIMNRIKIYGTDKSSWLPQVTRDFPSSYLPSHPGESTEDLLAAPEDSTVLDSDLLPKLTTSPFLFFNP